MNNSNHLPLVSVMIPYYNCQKYIIETIDSVEQQTYPNIEIIIVNDGSSEEDTLFLIDLLKNKSHIKYFYQENKGLSATRNAAATYAHGEYFLFLDADDVILPTYISQSVEILEKSPEVKLVYPLSEFFGAQTGIWQLPPYEGLKSILLGNRIPCIAIHRATHFRLSGGFDESLPTHEDWDLWIRMLAEGGEVFQIPEVLFRYRKRDDGSSLIDYLEKRPEINRLGWQRVCNKHQSLLLDYQLGYVDLFNEINRLTNEIEILKQKFHNFNEYANDKVNKLEQENKNLSFRIHKLQPTDYYDTYKNKSHDIILRQIYKSPSYKIIRFFKKLNWKRKKQPKRQLYYPSNNVEGYLEAIKILSSISWSLLSPLDIVYKIFKRNKNF